MRKILSFLITVYGFTAFSQDIATDNEGEIIFAIPSTQAISPQIALNNLGFNSTFIHLKQKKYFIGTPEPGNYTMYKSTTINFKANVINNDDDVLLIGKGMKITPHFEIGINRGIDELLKPTGIIYYTLSGSIFTDLQSFKLYDTISKNFVPNKYKRTSYGAKANFNIFFGTKSALAFSLTYKNSIVTDNLTSFQKRSDNEVYIDNNIASNGETDGYIGPISPSDNFRFSAAYPIFIDCKYNLTLIPYYFTNFGEISPKHNAGMMFTFLGEKFRNFDSVPSPTSYKFDTAFSVGLNLLSTGTDKHNYIFLSGTISFGKTTPKDSKDKPSSKNVL